MLESRILWQAKAEIPLINNHITVEDMLLWNRAGGFCGKLGFDEIR